PRGRGGGGGGRGGRPRPPPPPPPPPAPRAGRGRLARRLAGRLPLPRPVSLGLVGPFARPARAAVTGAAVSLGALGVTFAVGLGTTLALIQTENSTESPAAVVVYSHGPAGEHGEVTVGPAPAVPGPAAEDPSVSGPADPAAIIAAITAQAGTDRYFGAARTELAARGLVGTADVTALVGDPAAAARRLVAGTWADAPGEAVVDTLFLRTAGARIGDTVTLVDSGHSATVRIVGEMFDVDEGPALVTVASSLAALELDLTFSEFGVDLAAGTDLAGYVQALDEAVQPLGGHAAENIGGESSVILAMTSLIATLTLLIVAVAVLGVLNTVVLDTRERVHDLGVYKALGMTPRQTIAMVVTSAAGIGAVAGLVGVPLGVLLHHAVVPMMGDAVLTRMPHAYLAVYGPADLVPLALGGLVIAVVGALLPATWAAGTRTATALRTE
ncbi:ABC transporter permease, partial [Frankia sp. CNm7]|uniref:ABC transporter permease n=2 Tax=Frankia nepalensis TaxID=1836974 RepID=UPI00193153CD